MDRPNSDLSPVLSRRAAPTGSWAHGLLGTGLLLVPLACSSGADDSPFSTSFGNPTTTLSAGDGDGDDTGEADGDGDPGDGDPGDGDPGDGDPGDGDGDIQPDLPAGGPLAVNDLVPGDLVITEIMYNPELCGDTKCEWLEVLNLSGEEVDLLGMRIQDSLLSLTGTVDVSVIVPAGGYAWFGKGPDIDWLYSLSPDAYYGTNPGFNNADDDQAVILNDGGVLDTTAFYTAGDPGIGASWQLDVNSLDVTSNDNASSWCYSSVPFDGPDRGSPKAANAACP